MKKKNELIDITENPLYHDTWKLLKKSASAPITADGGRLSNRLVLFCGGIRRRTAWRF